jgi:salicylate hydroxylase
MLKLNDLTPLVEDSFANMESDYGSKFYHFHRVDLHNQLRELAEAPESASRPGQPVKIKLGAAVDKIDCINGCLTLKDGNEIKKDLLVVADGVKVWPS